MDRLNHRNIKQEVDIKEGAANIEEKQQDNDVKKKKNEEDDCAYIGLWGKDCGCKRCTRNRHISMEFNQTNATNERVKGSLGPFKKGAPFQCKHVKKEEDDDDAEWDEDCDCDHCGRMRLKDMRLKQTNATENGGDGGDDGEETEEEEESDRNENENIKDLTVGNEDSKNENELDGNYDGHEGDESQMNDEDNETEIDFEEYEMDVDGDESSDEETEVEEQSDREPENKLRRIVPDRELTRIENKSPKCNHVCEHCRKSFKTASFLSIHTRKLKCKKTFKCFWKGYNKTFSLKSIFKKHQNIHTREKLYKCPWKGCKRPFARKDSMSTHHKLHTPELLHKCDQCGKGFQTTSFLKRHLIVHTGEKPYKCSWKSCDKTFSLQSNLRKHQKSHTGEKPF